MQQGMQQLNPNDIMQMINQQGMSQSQSPIVDQMTNAPQVTGGFDQGEPMTMASMNMMPVDMIIQMLEKLYGENTSQQIGTSPAADQEMENMAMMQQMMPGASQQMPTQQMPTQQIDASGLDPALMQMIMSNPEMFQYGPEELQENQMQ